MKKKVRAAKIPYTSSKDPISILRCVVRAIKEEPRRYNQDVMVARRGDSTLQLEKWWPRCGIVACIAGWVCAVTNRRGSIPVKAWDVWDRARMILGITDQDSDGLFCEGTVGGIPGTRSHVCAGINHINKFAKKKWGRYVSK